MTDTETGADRRAAETNGVPAQHSEWRRRVQGAARQLVQTPNGERLVLAAGLVVSVLTALWLTSGAWGDQLPSGDDTIAHLIRTQFAIDHLISEGRIDGWAPSFILGYETFLFSGPAFSWAVALVGGMSFGLLSVAGAFKVVFVGSFVVLPLTVAFLARSFGLGRRAAGVAAILTLAVNNPFGGVGLTGLFDIGLATHQFGAIFFFLSLGGALRLLQHPSPRWTIFTGCSLAVLLTAHGLSVFIFVVLLTVVLITMLLAPRSGGREAAVASIVRREVDHRLAQLGIAGSADATPIDQPTPKSQGDAPSRSAMGHLAVAMALAGALAACIVLPLLVHRELQVSFSAWGTPPFGERVGHIWEGLILFRPGVAPLVLAGFVFGVVRVYRARRLALALIAVPPTFLVIAHASYSLWPTNVIPTQLTTRALGYIAVLAILPLASLIIWISGQFGRAGGPLALALGLAIVIIPLGPGRQTARQIDEPIPAMAEAARQLAFRVPDGARFATERDISDEMATTGLGSPHFWLAWASGRPTLNAYNVESSTTPGAAREVDSVGQRPPEVVADGLSRLGVTHLVTLSDDAFNRFAASQRFSSVWRSSPIAIFAVSPRPGQPEPAALVTATGPIDAAMVDAEPERLAIRVDAPTSVQATVAVAWSPKWHASLDGEPVPLERASDGLLQLQLPQGTYQLVLEFRRDAWDFLGLAISLITMMALFGWLLRRRRILGLATSGSDGESFEGSGRSAPEPVAHVPRAGAGASAAPSGGEEAAGQDAGPMEPEPRDHP